MWQEYQEKTKDSGPRPLLVAAISFTNGKRALDLGCGSLRDTKYLTQKGFSVTPVDSTEPLLADNNFIKSKIEDFDFGTQSYDLISAQFVLPFLSRKDIEKTFLKVYVALTSGGVFTCNLFGPNDSFTNVTKLTYDDVIGILDPFDILHFEEIEHDGPTVLGKDKHWHVFNTICIKP